jgi:hypothetical protein
MVWHRKVDNSGPHGKRPQSAPGGYGAIDLIRKHFGRADWSGAASGSGYGFEMAAGTIAVFVNRILISPQTLDKYYQE